MTFHSVRVVAFVLLAGTLFAPPVLADLPPAPAARTVPFTDDYFGTKVVDPYRWMEEPNNPELTAYLKSQNDRTQSILNSIPERKALAERIRSLTYEKSNARIVRRNGVYFTQPYSSQLFVSEPHGTRRLLLDLSKAIGHRVSFAYLVPSDDAKRIAVGLTLDGNERGTSLVVLDVATGKVLEELSSAQFGVSAWRGDGEAFYYLRFETPPAGAPPNATYRYGRTYLHVVGTPQTADLAVFGADAISAPSFAADEYGAVYMAPNSDWAVGVIRRGAAREIRLYLAPKEEIGKADLRWQTAGDYADRITRFAVVGDSLYFVTEKDARPRVLVTHASHPDVSNALAVFTPSAGTVSWLAEAKDALYLGLLENGYNRILKVAYATGMASEIALPVDGTVSSLLVENQAPGFEARIESWTFSPRWYAYDPAANKLTPSHLDFHPPVGDSSLVADEVLVRARDGVMVPLSIVHRGDIKLDGSNPTLLTAYGSYGISLSPHFSATRLAWFERGGVYAVAHVRGGGENGEAWHLAGKDAKKINTISDFIDCARWLIERGYTSPEKLGASGASAGGIPIGGAITQAPELFAAVIDEVPVSDELRIEFSANGPPNIPEFGSVTTEAGFRNLFATSAVQHIVPGGKYPAVMLTTGVNDARVDPWQAAKMTATLQADSVSGRPILLRVDFRGGHGSSEGAALLTDEFSFLLWNMGLPAFQPTV